MKKPAKEQIFPILLSILLTLLLGALSSIRNITADPATGKLSFSPNWAKLALIALVCAVSMSIHTFRQRRDPRYLNTLLGRTVLAGRRYDLDWLRLTATLSVIAAHTMSYAAGLLPPKSPSLIFLEAGAFLCLTSNLLFVMVSGSLLLPPNKESLWSFYSRRVLRVAVPMILYYLCYAVLLNGSSVLAPANWGKLIFDFFQGSPNVPHFWLIYVILLLYLVTPALKLFVGWLSERGQFAATFLFLFWDCAVTMLPLIGITPPAPAVFSCWVTVFILGHFLSVNKSRRYEQLLLAGGLVSLILTLPAVALQSSIVPFFYNYSPVMILLSSALFLIIKRRKASASAMPGLFSFISRYSFSVLLIHWYLLFYIVNDKLHLNGLSLGVAGGVPLTVFVTLALSLAFAFLFDNILVVVVEASLARFIRILSRLEKK